MSWRRLFKREARAANSRLIQLGDLLLVDPTTVMAAYVNADSKLVIRFAPTTATSFFAEDVYDGDFYAAIEKLK